MKKTTWAAACGAILSCVMTAQAAEPRMAQFTRYDAGEFTVITSRSASQARALVGNLAKFRLALETTLKRRATGKEFPTTIIICGNNDWRLWLQPRQNVGGFFQRGEFENFMALDGAESFDLTQVVLFHEYTHYFLASRFAGQYPPWFNEGLAELMGYAKFDEGRVILRIPGPRLTDVRMSEWIPFERMIRIDQNDPEYQSHKLAPSFYGQAWLTVQYGMVENREFGAQMFDYLADRNRLVPHEDAARKAFGEDLSVPDKWLRDYVRESGMSSGLVNIPVQPPVELGPGTPLDPVETMAIFADLMLSMGQSPDRVRPLIESLERRDPNKARAAIFAARLAQNTDDNAAFEAAVNRAEAAMGAGDSEQRRELAAVLLANGMRGAAMSNRSSEDTDRDVKRAYRWFAEAVQHNNEDVKALWGFGAAATRVGQNLDLAEQALVLAYQRAPASAEIAMALANVKARQDKPEEMIPFLEDAVRFATHLGMRRAATESLEATRKLVAERAEQEAEDRKRREEYERQLAEYEKKYGKKKKKN